MEGALRLRDVGFRYGGSESPPMLTGINLDIAPGSTVALVGRSGSGKTTLVKLLAGLLEPTEGTIELDRTDLRTVDYRTARRHIGFVLQESHLFDDTIARNIALGEAPDPDRVQWAAKVADIHDLVERLPFGYETRVGESGLRLSGGQAQRIAIARAIYRRPAVLLLDEASSALDAESERAVKQNLDELMHGRTAVVIAHRLSTVRDADEIVVLDRGTIIERGTHTRAHGAPGAVLLPRRPAARALGPPFSIDGRFRVCARSYAHQVPTTGPRREARMADESDKKQADLALTAKEEEDVKGGKAMAAGDATGKKKKKKKAGAHPAGGGRYQPL